MSYEPNIWVTGNRITADKLNHMEDGIESANSGGGTEPLIVSFDHVAQESGPIPTVVAYYDKTWQEISDALTANRPVYIKYGDFNTNNEYIEDGSSLVPIFRTRIEPAPEGEAVVHIAETLDFETTDVQLRELFAGADGQISLSKNSNRA